MNSERYVEALQQTDQKEEKIIDLASILHKDDEFEPGLLSDLKMDAPEDLHKTVIAQIRTEKKKRFYTNRKFYMPVAAAVLITAILVNGGKNFINPSTPNNIAGTTNKTPQSEQSSVSSKVAVNEPTKAPNTNQAITGDNSQTDSNKPAASTTAAVKDNRTDNSKTATVTPKPSAAAQEKSTASPNTDEKTIAMNTDISGKDIVSGGNSDSSIQNTEKDSNINLEITASSQSDVISFLKSYGTLSEDGKNKIYKLSTNYINQLNEILETGSAEGRVVNGNVTGDNFIVKLIVKE